jgi:hypothetical protein
MVALPACHTTVPLGVGVGAGAALCVAVGLGAGLAVRAEIGLALATGSGAGVVFVCFLSGALIVGNVDVPPAQPVTASAMQIAKR